MSRFLLLSTRASLLSLAAPSLALPPLLAYAGPAMAAGLQLYAGNSEVTMVELPFPWSWSMGPAVLGVALLILEWRTDKAWLWLPAGSALLASIVVSGRYLMTLFELAGA